MIVFVNAGQQTATVRGVLRRGKATVSYIKAYRPGFNPSTYFYIGT